jgi:acetyl-CoA carboxylase biotin carboxyl carrier protein
VSGLTHAQVRRILELVDSMSAESIEVEVEGFRLRVERSETGPAPERASGERPAPAPADEAAPLQADDVEGILALIEDSGFDVVELDTPDFKARVRRAGGAPAAPPAERSDPGAEPAANGDAPSPTPEGLVDITAPLVGTFYRSRSPGSAPFVDVGSAVSEETEVCIIEAMKLMNYIPAGVRGTVTEVLADNEQAVESGTPLFRVDPDGA